MFDFGSKFSQGLTYQDYLASHSAEAYRRRWQAVFDRVQLTAQQRGVLAGFVREMKVLCLVEAWCGACVNQGPIFQCFARAAPCDVLSGDGSKLKVRYFERDAHADLQVALRLCGGDRVPVVAFLSEDDYFLGLYGDRTLSDYRQMAIDELGPNCPSGIVPPNQKLLDAVTQDWLSEFERMQLMLRLSNRLRQKHGD